MGYNSIELALSVDNANNAQGTWIGSDNRIRARRIPFGTPPEGTRVLSPAGGTLTRDPVSVTDPEGVGTTMWLDSSSGTQQLYVVPADGGVLDGPTLPPPSVPLPPTPAPPPTSVSENCTRVKLIGAAGSGENDGGISLGTPVGALADGRHSGRLLPRQRFNGLRDLVNQRYGPRLS